MGKQSKKHKMSIMGSASTISRVLPDRFKDRLQGGDTVITWDPEKTEETEDAAKAFSEIIAFNFLAFDATVKDKPEQIRKFDPDAEEILLTPQIQGG